MVVKSVSACMSIIAIAMQASAAPGAGPKAQSVIRFLNSIQGRYTIAGSQCDAGLQGEEVIAIQQATGQTPLIIGFDFLQRSLGRVDHGADQDPVAYALEFAKEGGFVEFSWHWCLKDAWLKPGDDENGHPRWWGAFYASNANLDLEAIMNGSDKDGRRMIISDIDFIAADLKRLKDAGVVVLWRPLHEADGRWFWWGAAGPENFKKLWRVLYKRLVGHHGLDNLVWVWTGAGDEWYPGDEWVDVVGADIHQEPNDLSPRKERYDEVRAACGSAKCAALTEIGGLIDADRAFADGADWVWFLEWVGGWRETGGRYEHDHTSVEIWRAVYENPKVLTLEKFRRKIEKRKAKRLVRDAGKSKPVKSQNIFRNNQKKE